MSNIFIPLIRVKKPPNVEALRLYRDILRACRKFTWANEQGEPWGEVIKKSTRAEFEAARNETDPVLIARSLVVGRDCLMQLEEKMAATERKMFEHIQNTRRR
eukprot:GILJ01014214.1.p1 GENE.GILJ01014214.1~~GILJ01014214.1.p1  ORF type:complete len:103 (-),score=9.42 GILJ01014214.1:181-489(-)